MAGQQASAAAVSASRRKIEMASRGPTTNFSEKLGLVVDYVQNQAAVQQCAIADVPCPNRIEWAELSYGRRAILPNESQLSLYATDEVRQLAGQLGSMREAYIAAAKSRLRQIQECTR